jgi:protease I
MENFVGAHKPLEGAKIGVLIENKFIAEEIAAYQTGFAMLGAEVEFVSRIRYGKFKPKSATFYSDVDPLDSQPWESPQTIKVSRDISSVKPENYAAVIMSANYTSVRLRHSTEPETLDPHLLVKSAPAVVWFAEAMKNPRVIKGALCHGLWILTPNPELLKDRKVVCNLVVLADILNCGAQAVLNPKVVVDADLVTGYSKHEVLPFIQAIAQQILSIPPLHRRRRPQ